MNLIDNNDNFIWMEGWDCKSYNASNYLFVK